MPLIKIDNNSSNVNVNNSIGCLRLVNALIYALFYKTHYGVSFPLNNEKLLSKGIKRAKIFKDSILLKHWCDVCEYDIEAIRDKIDKRIYFLENKYNENFRK